MNWHRIRRRLGVEEKAHLAEHPEGEENHEEVVFQEDVEPGCGVGV